jgi:hypothetical protein
MQNLEKLAALAKDLPTAYAKGAEALVQRMGEVIEGLSDKPMEWRPSTLKLVQATTDRTKLPRGASIGSLVLGEEVLPTPVKTIPLRAFTTRQYWNPDPDKASMLCSSPDGEIGYKYGKCKVCPYSKFDEVEKKSQCNKTITIVSALEDLSNIYITNFSKTNYASGMDWQALMKKAGVSPYKRVYEMTSGPSPKTKNVEILKLEPVAGDNNVNPKTLAFLEELYKLVDTDRKNSLISYYEYVESKKDVSQLNMLGHEVEGGEGSVTLIAAPAADAPVSETPSGYKL